MCGLLDQAIVQYLNDTYFSYESEIKISQVMNLLVFSEPSQLLSSSCVLCSAPFISFLSSRHDQHVQTAVFLLLLQAVCWGSHHAHCCMVSQPRPLCLSSTLFSLFFHFSFYLLHSLYFVLLHLYIYLLRSKSNNDSGNITELLKLHITIPTPLTQETLAYIHTIIFLMNFFTITHNYCYDLFYHQIESNKTEVIIAMTFYPTL